MTALRLGSLFDGIGVFPLAAVRCGIEPIWASEIEKAPISITKRHFPDMAHLGDVTKLDGRELPPVHKAKVSEGRKRLSDEVQLANDAKQWVEAIQEYANITELDAATLNRLIKEIVVHERIDEDKTRHISIEIHFNLKPIPEVEQVTA